MSIKFINIKESEFFSKKLIYKYMPLEFALEAIADNYLWLSNPVKWNDPFEKRFIDAKYQVSGNDIEFPLKGQIFCACLTQTITSEAHWKNYSNGQIGLSFRINRKQLVKVLQENSKDYDIYIGKVEYIKTNDLIKRISEIDQVKEISRLSINNRILQIRLLLLKRIAFKYEDEIRILAIKKYKTLEDGIKLNYSMNPSELIDTITIDPLVGKNIEKMLKDLFKKEYGIKRVYKSTLYSTSTDIRIEI
jgi:hypothetical protein